MRYVILTTITGLTLSSVAFAQTDFNGDGTVDMHDFAAEQIAAGGSRIVAGDSAISNTRSASGIEVGISCGPSVVVPGGSVGYELVAHLSNEDGNRGLALIGINLGVDFVPSNPLPQAIPGPDMCTFVRNEGLTNPPAPQDLYCFNPSGYGGTIYGAPSTLHQIGGGQNTIGNTAPPAYPVGDVLIDFAHEPILIALGSFPAPIEPGVYSVTLSAGFGNKLDSAIGPPFAVSSAPVTMSPDSCQFTVDTDCNNNGQADSVEMANAPSTDCDGDGMLDECQPVTTALSMMQACMDGPCEGSGCGPVNISDPCCAHADRDSDGDVDLSDFSQAVAAQSPNQP